MSSFFQEGHLLLPLVTVSSSHVCILSPATVCICLVSQPKRFLNKAFTRNFRATRNARGSHLPFEVANIFFNAWSSWMASWLHPFTFLLIEKSLSHFLIRYFGVPFAFQYSENSSCSNVQNCSSNSVFLYEVLKRCVTS